MEKCFFCDGESTEYRRDARYNHSCYSCENCGNYRLFDSAKTIATANKHIISGYLYEVNRPLMLAEPNTYYELSSSKVETLLKDSRIPKTTMQKLHKILLHHYKLNTPFGEDIIPLHWTCGYARNEKEYRSMIKALSDSGYIEPNNVANSINGFLSGYSLNFTLTGIELAEQLTSTNINSKRVFVAMGFKDDLLEACEWAIKPACLACGFDAILISDTPHNNGITDEIMTEIKRSKFVIVDFTYNNNGAYFEAGYAQGLGRPIIRCCKEEWFDEKDENGNKINALHFDVQHYNTIIWKDHEDLCERLKNNIRVNIEGAILSDIIK